MNNRFDEDWQEVDVAGNFVAVCILVAAMVIGLLGLKDYQERVEQASHKACAEVKEVDCGED